MPRKPLPKSRRQYVLVSEALEIAKELKGAKRAAAPKFIEPSLATLRDRPPSGDAWLHEIKFDGYRLQAHVKDQQARFFTRRGYDWTKRFKALGAPFWYLPTRHAVIDGEVVVLLPEGQSDFGALQDDLGEGRSDRFVFFAFDLLYLDGLDLRGCALVDRKLVLQTLLEKADGNLRYSAHLEEDAKTIYRNACRLKLEGIVSKRKDARYVSGRSANWTKVTCRKRATFVVAGIAYNRNRFEGIYLARPDDMTYAGKVEHGFTPVSQKELEKRAKGLESRTQPLARRIRKPKAHWLKPELLVEVEYRALTGEGKVRHPSFKGIREDL